MQFDYTRHAKDLTLARFGARLADRYRFEADFPEYRNDKRFDLPELTKHLTSAMLTYAPDRFVTFGTVGQAFGTTGHGMSASVTANRSVTAEQGSRFLGYPRPEGEDFMLFTGSAMLRNGSSPAVHRLTVLPDVLKSLCVAESDGKLTFRVPTEGVMLDVDEVRQLVWTSFEAENS